MDKPRIYRTDDDVLLNLQRSLDLMNCAIRILGSGEKNMQMYVMSLVDVAAHLTQQSTNSLDLGEQADTGAKGITVMILCCFMYYPPCSGLKLQGDSTAVSLPALCVRQGY
ncbi:hypothetical protein [Salmonella enterica]|uniref:hypothetical protein n=1 Tax=Salmonella enterica TaxID=28901 RepID=UPI00362CAFD6